MSLCRYYREVCLSYAADGSSSAFVFIDCYLITPGCLLALPVLGSRNVAGRPGAPVRIGLVFAN